jgi:hypothetical protein
MSEDTRGFNEEDLRAVETLMSMCLSAIRGDRHPDKETFISNLRLFANGMEYGRTWDKCGNCGEGYVLAVYTACPNCHVKDREFADAEEFDQHMREIHR